MITQGSNRPLVIGLPLSVTDAEEIHVGLYGSTGQIKHWQNDDTHSQVEISDDGMALICAMTQADTAGFPAGRAHCAVKWLDSDGIVHQLKELPISIKRYSDSHVLGDDEAVTTADLFYDGSLEEAQGILTPESIRTAIVIKAGTVTDTQAQTVVNAWLTAHASQIKGAKGDPGAAGSPGANGKSAYQLAVEGGYTGTQAEWLASLKGAKGDPGTDGDDYVLTQDDKDEIADMAADRITVPVKVSDLLNDSGYITSSAISGKVDKVTGKGLSTNDYDNASKAKVDAIPSNPKYTDTVYDDSLIKQDISALQTGKADTSHSHTTADLTDWIPMSTAVKTALTSTTDPAWTATEQASARARLGIGDGKLELIDEITLESDQTLDVSTEPNGTPYNFSAVFIDAEALENFTAWREWMFLSSANSNVARYRIGRNYSVSNNKRVEIICNNFCGVWRTEFFSIDSEGKSSLAHYNCFELEDDYKDAVRRIYMDGLKAGTTIKIYAIRA